jgi:ABC-2 type transport system permease protein
VTLWRLEWLRLTRTRRLVALVGVYVFFGFLGPLTARYLPQIIERFGGDQFQVVVPEPVPADGIIQFASSATQIGLLVAVVVAAGALTLGAVPEMAVFLRTRVASPARLVLPRYAVAAGAAAAAYTVGAGVAWYETAVLLGALPVGGMLVGMLLAVLYLAFAAAVVAVVGSRFDGLLATVLGSLVVLLILPLAGIAESVGRWLPSHLVGAQTDLVAGGAASDYLGATAVTLAVTVLLLAGAMRRAGAREW